MKEPVGELNMTIIVIVAAGLIILFLTRDFLPTVFDNILDRWNERQDQAIENSILGDELALFSLALPDYIDLEITE